MADDEKVLKNMVKKGKVVFGTRQTMLSLNDGKAKLVVMANNCPSEQEIKTLTKSKQVPLYETKANSIDLGYTCGKQFAVSVFAVLDDGGVNISQLVKKR